MYPVSFPGAKEIKKPENMTDEECTSVWAMMGFDTLFRMMKLGSMIPAGILSAVDEQKFPFYLTAWMPNKEDRDAINSGRPIFIKTIAHQLPPMAVFTLDENEQPNYPVEKDLLEELEELRSYKKQAEESFNELIFYAANHPDSKTGMSISKFVLEGAKGYDVLNTAYNVLVLPIVEALRVAKDTLLNTYDMTEWPASEDCRAAKAIQIIDKALIPHNKGADKKEDQP